MLAVGGKTCIEVSGEPSTTMAELPLSVPSCAMMVAFPADSAVTKPPAVTLATLGALEVQVTMLVITCALPSLYVPVATQFTEVVGASTALAGVTEMEVRMAELTFSGALPETPLKVAEILAVPGPIPVALPPAATVATAGLSDAQVESVVMTCLVPSLKTPIAAKVNLVPGAMVRPEGVTEIDTIVALETLSVVEPLIESSVAVIVVDPVVRPFARPPRAIVATALLDEIHDTCPFTL